MGKKLNAIVLGGTSSHIALINNLKNRGYYTILVDYYDNPPAKSYADQHIQESTLDLESITEVAKKYDAALVANVCLDQPIHIVCLISEKLGLPAPYSSDTALLVTDKGLMKKRMVEFEIPTSPFTITNSLTNLAGNNLKFPLIVKPIDGTGALGINKAESKTELDYFIEEALVISRSKKVIIEEFFEGRELNIHCFVSEGLAHVIMISEKRNIMNCAESVLLKTGTLWPAMITNKAERNIGVIANQVARAFNLINSPLLIQAIVQNDNINVIEIAARLGGSGISYKIIKKYGGFDILDAAINSCLGTSVKVQCNRKNIHIATNFLYAQSGIVGSISGHEELIKQGIIEDIFYYKSKGMKIKAKLSSRSRVAGILLESKSRRALLQNIEHAVQKLDVHDLDGKSILRRDIYLRD